MEAFINVQNDQQIPLLCTVCPETPRFSDVSHLLTHIASKGHLHHETQTKLKSHQDLAAAVALQQYEQWYRDYRIESLLVERMKAKQIKEVARHRRSRATVLNAQQTTTSKPRKRNRRDSSASVMIKPEDLSEDTALYPDVFATGDDRDLQADYIVRNDSLSLKGQIWPGMGKMDLADDDMKRTRNQKKPKSAIERMRRTSEGIEPNQVIMTADFEVERIKGVYDESSSPIPGQEDATPPRKVTKPRRKKVEPLTEISSNIPRGHGRKSKGTKKDAVVKKGDIEQPRAELRSFSRPSDAFRDSDTAFNLYDSKPYLFTSSSQSSRFEIRDGSSMHTPNSIGSHHGIYSTTHDTFNNGTQSSGRDTTRGRRLALPFIRHLSHSTIGAYSRTEGAYPFHDGSTYSSPSQTPVAENHQPFLASNQHRLPSQAHCREKHDFFPPTSIESVQPYAASTNPLYSQDHMLFRSYEKYPPRGPHSELADSLPSAIRLGHRDLLDASQPDSISAPHNGVKLEPNLCDSIELTDCDAMKQHHFISHSQWDNVTTAPGNATSPTLDQVEAGI